MWLRGERKPRPTPVRLRELLRGSEVNKSLPRALPVLASVPPSLVMAVSPSEVLGQSHEGIRQCVVVSGVNQE